MSLVVHKWHVSPLVSVIAWDGVVTESFCVWSFATLFATYTTHIFPYSLVMACPKPSDVLLSILVQIYYIIISKQEVASLSWADSDWTPLRSVYVFHCEWTKSGSIIHYHLRLKISYCPFQRPLCGKACVSRLGVAYSSVLDSGYIICPSLIWWFLWCFCSQEEFLSLWSRQCANENYTFCVYSVTMQEKFL